ncbi:MAG: DUF6318 family protein, partial [Intrasporangium sp.]|uniref:DUF6318 family protein n=1 Tax=Intrasporangium sp. TaxID=1925024 RepID=UPI003F7F868C
MLAKIPKKARAETKEAAVAFAAYYLKQLDVASRQGDPSALTGLTLDTCKMCENFFASVSSLKEKGQHHEGTTLKVRRSDSLRFTANERTVLLDVQLFSVPIVNDSGVVVGKTEADSGSFVATLKFDRRWFIERLQVV